eukprot:1195082-Prorocentrum_minimum.AAC.2
MVPDNKGVARLVGDPRKTFFQPDPGISALFFALAQLFCHDAVFGEIFVHADNRRSIDVDELGQNSSRNIVAYMSDEVALRHEKTRTIAPAQCTWYTYRHKLIQHLPDIAHIQSVKGKE